MPPRKKPAISLRKRPQQERSNQLVEAVLQAATQVLAKEGAQRFTTARVAEKAGVAVGSLYQYFPNKAAILFRLQADEWRQTHNLLRSILEDTATPPPQRLRTLVHAFIQSECDEAKMRGALHDAAPLYRDAPEARQARESGKRIMHVFMQEALPDTPKDARELVANLVKSTLSAVGQRFSETPRSVKEIETYADALADMFCAYLEQLRCSGEKKGDRRRHAVASPMHEPVLDVQAIGTKKSR